MQVRLSRDTKLPAVCDKQMICQAACSPPLTQCEYTPDTHDPAQDEQTDLQQRRLRTAKIHIMITCHIYCNNRSAIHRSLLLIQFRVAGEQPIL